VRLASHDARVRAATADKETPDLPTRLRTSADGRYRLPVRIVAAVLLGATGSMSVSGCVSIDPGTNYVVPPEDFNANYFYCFVEPEVIFGGADGQKSCGSGANVAGASSGGCHFSDKVPAMLLTDHPAIACTNGVPDDPTQVGEGSAAANNLGAVALEFSTDWQNSPLYLWPTQIVTAHPVPVFPSSDTSVTKFLAMWATE